MSEQPSNNKQSNPSAARVVKRSRTGCPECRRRKIRCDETKPQCRNCRKSGRTCGLVDTMFRPHALSSQVASASTDSHDTTRGSYNDDDEAMDGEDAQEEAPISSGRLAGERSFGYPGSGSPAIQRFDHIERDLQPDTPITPVETQAPRAMNDNSYLPHAEQHATSFSQSSFSPIHIRVSVAEELEESFFGRYFSENIAPWFDVVNFQRYFGHECIVIIREHALLRYATCALAAKQLGQISTSNARPAYRIARSIIAQQLLSENLDFSWYGAKYYDKAIKTLAASITTRDTGSEPSPASVGSMLQNDLMTRAEGEDPIVRLLSTCLLIQYEHLSGNTKGWSGHLDGFSELLAILDDGSLFYTNPLSQQVFEAKSQRALRAAFWWYVVNDLEESFVSRRTMRIDPENLSLWRHMGLHTTDDGEVINLETSETPGAPPHLQEDLLSFALIRILCKLINCLALPRGAEESIRSPYDITYRPGSSSEADRFRRLQLEVEKWSSMKTAAFRPDVSWRLPQRDEDVQSNVFGSETWYSHYFRAVTMLYYHMARMLLLIHQPPPLLFSSTVGSPGSPFDMLSTLRNIEQQLQSHARDIVSIVDGMPDDGAVRTRAVQPLFVAGKSLTSKHDRQRLVSMIRAIQDDLGMKTEYRVVDLLKAWNSSLDSLGLAARPYEGEEL